MEDKNEQILKNYNLKYNSTYKKRGFIYIDALDGLYVLRPYDYSERRATIENLVKEELIRKGFENVDYLLKNTDDEYISYNKYSNKFIIKRWYAGEECDINSVDDICTATHTMANLHKVMENILDNNEEAIRIPRLNIIEEYENNNREMKRIKRYINSRKKKNPLETAILKHMDTYIKQADYYTEKLKNSSYMFLYNDALESKKLVHGSFNQHAVLMCNEDTAIINFDKIFYGVQVYDLYCFLRKVMEKNDWDIEIGMKIIDEYDKFKQLTEEEKEILYILLGYPEKFYKLVNSYYNGKKVLMSIRISEKLEELVISEVKKLYFLESIQKKMGLL